MNRALPDAEFDAFVDALATRISCFDKWAIANTKHLVNDTSLPPDVEMSGLGRLHDLHQATSGAGKNQSPPGSRAPEARRLENRLGFYVRDELGLNGEREIGTAYLTF